MLKAITIPRAYTAIVDEIQRSIARGDLTPGEKLPTERVLSQELGVSRSSVREALTALEVMGVIESRRGSGNFVMARPPNESFEVQMATLISEGGPLEILEARRLIEPGLAGLAAERRTGEDQEDMRLALQVMRKALANEEVSNSWESDWGFHLATARAAKNPLIESVFEVLTHGMDGPLWQEMRKKNFQAAMSRAEHYLSDHHAIYRYVTAGDGARARQAMEVHLERIWLDLQRPRRSREVARRKTSLQ